MIAATSPNTHEPAMDWTAVDVHLTKAGVRVAHRTISWHVVARSKSGAPWCRVVVCYWAKMTSELAWREGWTERGVEGCWERLRVEGVVTAGQYADRGAFEAFELLGRVG